MGIIKGSVTLTRYQVKGEPPAEFKDFLDRRIRRFAFQEIEDSAEELSAGWVSPHDYLDAGFAYAPYSLDPYVVLGLRIDQRKVGGALLKKYHRLEMKRAYAERQAKLSRAEREELKEKVRLQLLTRMPPASKVAELVWNTASGEAWLGSSARQAREIAEDLFRRSFELDLLPVIPWHLAQRLAPQGAAQRLEEARPLTLHAAEG
jgi:DNA recombination-dependent growth factor C